MDSELISQPETDEDVLTFDVPDAALERAAEAQAFTLAYCTHQLGQFCLASSRSNDFAADLRPGSSSK
jgi:hypothetical protein